MVVAIKYGVDMLKGARLDTLVQVASLKQILRVLHHLDWFCAQLARRHRDIGDGQPRVDANLVEIQRLGLAAFRDDQNAVTTRAVSLPLALQLLVLALLWGVVAPHQSVAPICPLMMGTAP